MFSYTILKRKMKYVNISSIENHSQKYGGIMSTGYGWDSRSFCSAPRF